ncbi:hypothetical protein [Natrinema salifodinae]|uniref:Uncharacterized protein n=1 Tax=Natrinema salifodinae TaxID=1202768 RepID=A0A1I0QJ52_9EURY|nr:hypothetical protein [Natrinema salifodinae]SEW27056.1 hypothetical protein SAMN05216285_3640 [Natrinema salifodinae]
MYSRRRVLQLGSASVLAGLAGWTVLTVTGGIGFRLRNYTSESYEARVTIEFYGRTAFERTYRLPAASGADPFVRTEKNAISNAPNGATYTATLFLDGKAEQTISATVDCTDRDEQEIDEEIDIDVGFGGDDSILMADSNC